MSATVKGYTPAQMSSINKHRDRGPICVNGSTVRDRIEIALAITLAFGSTVFGLLVIWSFAMGQAQ